MNLQKPGTQDIFVAQITVMMCAVEALIATHPEPDKVRQQFDQLFGQVQAGSLARGTTPLGTGLMREYAEHLFSPPSTAP